MPKRCSYCKNIRHNINKCQHPTSKSLHNMIESKAAISYLFPSLKDSLIRSKLEKLKVVELKVLTNNWILNPEDPIPKKKQELILLLTESYLREKSQEEDKYFEKYIKIYETPSYTNLDILRNLMEEIININPTPSNLHEILEEINNFYKNMEEKLQKAEENVLIELRRNYYRFKIKPCQIINMKNFYLEENKSTTFECSICLNDEVDIQKKVEIKECKHSFCGPCMISYLDKQQVNMELEKLTCPLCRGQIKCFNINDQEICQTISTRFCKFRQETKKIYYGTDEDNWINYLLSWLPF